MSVLDYNKMKKIQEEEGIERIKPMEYLVEYKNGDKSFQVYEKLFIKQDLEKAFDIGKSLAEKEFVEWLKSTQKKLRNT